MVRPIISVNLGLEPDPEQTEDARDQCYNNHSHPGIAFFARASIAPHVCGPTIPSVTSPARAWKFNTAALVLGPNALSSGSLRLYDDPASSRRSTFLR